MTFFFSSTQIFSKICTKIFFRLSPNLPQILLSFIFFPIFFKLFFKISIYKFSINFFRISLQFPSNFFRTFVVSEPGILSMTKYQTINSLSNLYGQSGAKPMGTPHLSEEAVEPRLHYESTFAIVLPLARSV